MRGMRRRWVVGSIAGDPRESLARRLLRQRAGDDERRRRILETPQLSDLHPPGSLPGAAAAAEAIVRAGRDGRRIAIYGDYDVDGLSATAILWHMLPMLAAGARVETFLPHRIEHGYGLNAEALRGLRGRGVETVITVDCGITAAKEAMIAEELGLELVITDHHALEPGPVADGGGDDAVMPGDAMVDDGGPTSARDASGAMGEAWSTRLVPRARAIAHPDLPGEAAPFRGLCGAAVAWKVACAASSAAFGRERIPDAVRRRLVELLPLVALGTIADVMSLEDENRIFAAIGLRGLPTSPIPGLAELVRSESRSGRVDAETIGFRLAPMLNACGRLGHAAEALELLTSASGRRAAEIVRSLAALNEERKRLERECAERAAADAVRLGLDGDDRRAIVLSDPQWHEGVVGIACSRLVERFGRPTVLLQERGGIAKGSGRSIPGVHLLECLRACPSHLFRRLGGHAMAVGLEIDAANIGALRDALVAEVNRRLDPEELVPTLAIDGRVTLADLPFAAIRELDALQPFGRGNPRPRFVIERAALTAPARRMGSGDHAEFWVADANDPRRTIRVIWWNGAGWAAELPVGSPVELVVDARIDGFRGVEEPLLTALDARYPAPITERRVPSVMTDGDHRAR